MSEPLSAADIPWNGNGNAGQDRASTPATHLLDVALLLEHVRRFVRRFVVLTDEQAIAIALWVAHTHAFTAADTTPYLAINSATKRAGKTRLLEVLDVLVLESWLTGRASPAVLIRKIDAVHPTLLLDESDAAFKVESDYSEALRGVLNSGYKKSGRWSLCVGQGTKITYKDFETFCPKAIAGIGRLPDTVADRAIPILLKRRTIAEPVDRFRERDARRDAVALVSELQGWASTHSMITRLTESRPELVPTLNDRRPTCGNRSLRSRMLRAGPGRSRRDRPRSPWPASNAMTKTPPSSC